MSGTDWVDTYSICYWRIPWSSYPKLTLVGIELKTTEFCSYTLTNWAILPQF